MKPPSAIHSVAAMLRGTLVPAFLLLASGSGMGGVRSLAPGVEVLGASNPGAVLFFDWTGDGHDELAVLDLARFDLSLRTVDLPGYYYSAPTVHASGLQVSANLFARDVNGDGKNDLVLTDGGHVRVWLARTRVGVTPATPDVDMVIPGSDAADAWVVDMADFDGDGKPDLIVRMPGPYPFFSYARWEIVFSFNAASPSMATVSDGTTRSLVVVRNWDADGRSVIAEAGNSNDVDVAPYRIYSVAPNRVVAVESNLPGSGRTVELDGHSPPEWVEPIGEYIETASGWKYQRSLRVHSLIVGKWELAGVCFVDQIEILETPPRLIDDRRSVVGDFLGDGRQELIFQKLPVSNGADGNLMMLEMKKGTDALTLREIPAVGTGNGTLRVIDAPDSGRLLLGVSECVAQTTDIFGRSAAFAEGGWRVRARISAVDAVTPVDLDIPRRLSLGRIGLAQMGGSPLADLGVTATDASVSATFHPGGRTSPHSATPGRYPGDYNHPASADSMLLTDLTGDGRAEMVTTDDNGAIRIHATQPDGHYDLYGTGFLFSRLSVFQASNALTPNPTRVIGTGDLDGDGKKEILYIRGDDEAVCSATNNAGTLSNAKAVALAGRWRRDITKPGYTLIGAGQTVVADSDGDGSDEILTFPSALGNRIGLHRRTGVGFGIEPVSGEVAGLVEPCLLKGRFSGDITKPVQIVLGGLGGEAVVCFAGGANGMSEIARSPLPGFTSKMAVMDLDGDGFDDLIAAGGSATDVFGNPVGSAAMYWLRCNGDGSFGSPVYLRTPLGFASQLAVADVTGDGVTDLVVASQDASSVEIFETRETSGVPSFADWCQAWGLADAATDADPDGDGLENLLEYARGTSPAGPVASPPTLTGPSVSPRFDMDTSHVFGSRQMVHPRPRLSGGRRVDVVLEASSDMMRWTTSPVAPSVEIDPASSDWEILRWKLEWQPGSAFYRFRITLVAELGQ